MTPNKLIVRKDFPAIGYYGPNREMGLVAIHGVGYTGRVSEGQAEKPKKLLDGRERIAPKVLLPGRGDKGRGNDSLRQK